MILRDSFGREVKVPTPALRIVSFAPSVSENLHAIGAAIRLVGGTTVDDYPAAVKRLPKVGDAFRPNIERIRALRPDLGIVESSTADRAAMDAFQKRLGIPIFALQPRTFADVPRNLLVLGELAGARFGAARAASEMREKAAAAARRVAGKEPVTVFVEINATPLYAAGPGTFIDDLVRLAGGRNIVRGTNPFPVYSREALLAANPQHYVVAAGGSMGRGAAARTLAPPLDRIAAAQAGNIHAIDADLLLRPTPRLADGLLLLAQALHP